MNTCELVRRAGEAVHVGIATRLVDSSQIAVEKGIATGKPETPVRAEFVYALGHRCPFPEEFGVRLGECPRGPSVRAHTLSALVTSRSFAHLR